MTSRKNREARFQLLKRQAEELLDRMEGGGQESDVGDVRELLHKLSVSQVELELQNEELEAVQAELETSRDKYVKLYDFAPTGYFLFDEDGLIIEANLTGARLLGVNRNHLVKKPFMTYVASASQTLFFSHRSKAFATRLPQACELELVCRGGASRIVQLHSVVLDEKHSSQPGEGRCLTSITDVTDRKKLERELTAARIEAESANRAKSEFLARMSHEIRTPLHGILGMTQLLASSSLDENQRSHLKMVEQSGLGLLHIVNDILDISRVEIGVLQLEREPFSLRQLVADSLAPLELQARQKDLRFEVAIDDAVPDLLEGDAPRLKQVLVNLAGNAVKFAAHGAISLQVRLQQPPSRVEPEATLLFRLQDSGVGISRDKLPFIFEKFYQADTSMTRQYEGTGLGLTICKHIVELMGGAIWVESEQGRGSTFYFTVPLPLAGQEDDAHERQEAPQEQALPSLRILLAEDNVVNQTFAQLLLQREGHEVVTVSNGQGALEALEGAPRDRGFDVVLMDVRMPGMDGVETTRRIRALKDPAVDSQVPIIAMTAHSLKGDRERFLKAGMDDYVSKPMAWEEVTDAIRRVLQAKGRLPGGK